VISVITAALAADIQFADRLRDSVLQQTGADWEWVVQEDGPTTAWEALASDPRVKVGNHPTAIGPAAARNLAIARTSGDIVRNVDADDELTGGVLAYTASVFRDHPEVDYLVGPIVDVLDDGAERQFAEVLDPGAISPGTLYQQWLQRAYFGAVHPTAMAARKSVIVKYGGYSALPVSEDTALLLALSQQTTGWFADRPLARHRKRAGSITSRSESMDGRAKELRHRFIQDRCHLLVGSK